LNQGHGLDVANAYGPEYQSFFASFCSQKEVLYLKSMHVCLVIDLLTAIALLHGLRYSDTRFRKQLCLASLLYLGFVCIHTYVVFASYFGFFERYPSFATRGLDLLLRFFGGFWMLFGVMVLAKGVSWIALAFCIYAVARWFEKSRLEPRLNNKLLHPPESH
jgi:hypothetical protein